ncbi:MAG: hypothetical protein IKW06_03430 [Clostridia bacterium]|nr:hypothetical protein [Clostridia bacterium]
MKAIILIGKQKDTSTDSETYEKPHHKMVQDDVDFGQKQNVISKALTPECIMHIAMAYASCLPEKAKILLDVSDDSRFMMIKFALLTGLMSTGRKVYNIVGGGDRNIAKFALRKLSLEGGIHLEMDEHYLYVELLDKNGVPVDEDVIKKVCRRVQDKIFCRKSIENMSLPINISRLALDYFRDTVLTTPNKRLPFRIGVCTRVSETKEHFKKFGAAFGISLLFTNEPTILPVLIQKNELDFGIYIGPNGKFGLYDENGQAIGGDVFYALVTLILSSAKSKARIRMPRHTSAMVDAVSEVCGSSVCRTKDSDMESLLLKDGTPIARLQHDLCFDPIRAMIRLCEFLHMNQCTLSYICHLLPTLHTAQEHVEVPEEKTTAIIDKIKKQFGKENRISLGRGIKIINSKGSVLIVPNTETHSIRVFAESVSEEVALETVGNICNIIKESTKTKE